jgi:sulfate transport system ATP-binding protein
MHVTTIFVTHDQEEAMEVADEIVVINRGRIEQTGSPEALYDRPANDFVMDFLGDVTTLNGAPIRPHDIEILTAPVEGSTPAEVTALNRIGFQVRVELRAAAERPWAQLTRGQAELLALKPGDLVWLRASR